MFEKYHVKYTTSLSLGSFVLFDFSEQHVIWQSNLQCVQTYICLCLYPGIS